MILQERGRSDAKHAVEEYVNEMRDKLSEAYIPFVKDTVSREY